MDSQLISDELDCLYSESDSSPPKKRFRKSKLAPFRQEILARIGQGKSYRQIRDWLFSCHGLSADHTTVFDFVKRCLGE